jgi:putative lipoprotein
MRRLTQVLATIVAASICVACNDGSSGADPPAGATQTNLASITGTISYRDRIALTNEAVAVVTLEDGSRQDAPATPLALHTISDPGQVPIRFAFDYPRAAIDPRMSYILRARITDRGRLMFATDTHTPVLTRGAGNEVQLLLVHVDATSTGPVAPVTAGSGMPLRGMFRYMADAAHFRDCHTNREVPVAMEGAYIEVERAYAKSGIEPGSELLVEVTGRYLDRPAMEENISEINLIIDSFNKILPDETCTPQALAELVGTSWKLSELAGSRVRLREGTSEAYFVLEARQNRVRGHAGCNSFFGGFEAGQGTLSFADLGATMLACVHGMDTERAFLQALGETRRYEISGLFLSLYDGDRLLARFEAIYR